MPTELPRACLFRYCRSGERAPRASENSDSHTQLPQENRDNTNKTFMYQVWVSELARKSRAPCKKKKKKQKPKKKKKKKKKKKQKPTFDVSRTHPLPHRVSDVFLIVCRHTARVCVAKIAMWRRRVALGRRAAIATTVQRLWLFDLFFFLSLSLLLCALVCACAACHNAHVFPIASKFSF